LRQSISLSTFKHITIRARIAQFGVRHRNLKIWIKAALFLNGSIKINILFRKTFLSIGIAALILTAIGDSIYRNWIYSNNYFDFGLANYLPSITGTISAVFLLCSVSRNFPGDIVKSASSVIVGCALYEMLQPVFRTGVFDWQDLIAVLLTGIVVLLVFKAFSKKTGT